MEVLFRLKMKMEEEKGPMKKKMLKIKTAEFRLEQNCNIVAQQNFQSNKDFEIRLKKIDWDIHKISFDNE